MLGHPLTESMILRRAQKEHIEQVKRVNLWGLRICDASLLFRIPTLEVISLSSNNISNLEPFSACTNLKELYLRNNSIFDLNEVRHLSNLSSLHTLFLLGNPCCYPPNIDKVDVQAEVSEHYRPTVIKHVPSLIRLDLKMVTDAERLSIGQLASAPTSPNNDAQPGTTDDIQPSMDNQTPNDAVQNVEQGRVRPKEDDSNRGYCPDSASEAEGSHPVTDKSYSAEPEKIMNRSLESIRQTISNLSLVHKQTLTEILHLLPRLNDDALSLLANEIAKRRCRHGDLMTPTPHHAPSST